MTEGTEMRLEKREVRLHQAFEVTVILKGLNAGLQVVLGLALLVTTKLNDLIIALVQNELIEDPNDFLASHAEKLVPYLTPRAEFFAALYLLSHGILKGILIAGLLRGKLWAYPASLGVFSLFILYQLLKWTQNGSWLLLALTAFDLVVMWLIYHEWKHHAQNTATL